jgi:hypothetical protein
MAALCASFATDLSSQFLGNQTTSGHTALAAYDANHDGGITDADFSDPANAAKPQLRIWVDNNGNHQVDPGELLTLGQAGVASISVAGTNEASQTFSQGNQIVATGTFTRTDRRTFRRRLSVRSSARGATSNLAICHPLWIKPTHRTHAKMASCNRHDHANKLWR